MPTEMHASFNDGDVGGPALAANYAVFVVRTSREDGVQKGAVIVKTVAKVSCSTPGLV